MPKMDERVHTRGRSRAALDGRFLGGVIAVGQTHHEPLVPMPGAQHETTRSSQREAQDASHQHDINLDLLFRADDTRATPSMSMTGWPPLTPNEDGGRLAPRKAPSRTAKRTRYPDLDEPKA